MGSTHNDLGRRDALKTLAMLATAPLYDQSVPANQAESPHTGQRDAASRVVTRHTHRLVQRWKRDRLC